METKIYTNATIEEREMSRKELADLRTEVAKGIRSWFKWSDYKQEMRHLVYYVELDNTAYVYRHGLLLADDEFDTLVANREGVTFAGVMHRKD